MSYIHFWNDEEWSRKSGGWSDYFDREHILATDHNMGIHITNNFKTLGNYVKHELVLYYKLSLFLVGRRGRSAVEASAFDLLKNWI